MSGMHTHGQHGALLRTEIARRTVEPGHLKFVDAHKHRMSWQAMAAACGVNQVDLQRAYHRPAKPPEPVKAAPAIPTNVPGIGSLDVLRAIKRGAVSDRDIAEACRCSTKHADALVADLKRRGWLAGRGGTFSGWVITDAGAMALKPVTRRIGPTGRVTKYMRLLRLIQQGVTDRDGLAATLEISVHSLDVYLSRLRHDGLLTGFASHGGAMQLTPLGVTAVEVVMAGEGAGDA